MRYKAPHYGDQMKWRSERNVLIRDVADVLRCIGSGNVLAVRERDSEANRQLAATACSVEAHLGRFIEKCDCRLEVRLVDAVSREDVRAVTFEGSFECAEILLAESHLEIFVEVTLGLHVAVEIRHAEHAVVSDLDGRFRELAELVHDDIVVEVDSVDEVLAIKMYIALLARSCGEEEKRGKERQKEKRFTWNAPAVFPVCPLDSDHHTNVRQIAPTVCLAHISTALRLYDTGRLSLC